MSPLLLGAALGATGAFILDPQQGRRRRAQKREVLEQAWTPGVRALVGGVGVASGLYALARGGFGALVPLAIGAALVACAVKTAPRP